MRRHSSSASGCVVSLAVAAAAAWFECTASAADVDTAYGRIDGDLSASAAVGTSFGPRGPRAAADLRLRYVWTAGFFVTYEDGSMFGGVAEPLRALATGVELRPLFFAKWLQGKESGKAHFDLALDSLGLELGAVFSQPDGARFASTRGLQAGIGLQVPILPRATGPFVGVHGGARWSDASLAGKGGESPIDRSLFLLVTVGFQEVFGARVVDLGDRAP